MTFNLDGLPDDVQSSIARAIEMRNEVLKKSALFVQQSLQESIDEVKRHVYGRPFKGVDAALDTIIQEQKAVFAGKFENIIERGLLRVSYAGLSIGNGLASGNVNIVRNGALARSQAIAQSTLKKKRVFNKKEFVLSDRIWDLSGNNFQKIRAIINSGINTDAVDVAKALDKYVRKGAKTFAKDYPNMFARMEGRIPERLSYEALRLARNEMAETYWAATLEGYRDNPAIKAVKWLLSNNRIQGLRDVCDDMANDNAHRLGAGIFPIGQAPAKPHIQCLCTLAPIVDNDIGEAGTATRSTKGSGGTSFDRTKPLDAPWFIDGIKEKDKQSFTNDFEKLSDESRIIFAKHTKNLQGDFYSKKSPCYDLRLNAVFLNITKKNAHGLDAGFNTDMQAFLHETGHWLDFNVLGRKKPFNALLPKFREKLTEDALSYSNTVLKEYYEKNGGKGAFKPLSSLKKIGVDEKKILCNNLKGLGGRGTSVSDLFSGLTLNRVRGWGYHETKYWRKAPQLLVIEAVAHSFEALGSGGERLALLKKTFPSAYAYFYEAVKKEIL